LHEAGSRRSRGLPSREAAREGAVFLIAGRRRARHRIRSNLCSPGGNWSDCHRLLESGDGGSDLWIISRHQNTLHKDTWRSPWTWVAGIAFALHLAAWHFAIRLTSVTNATLLANCAVLLVPPLSWLFLRRAVRLSTIGYGALAFLGIALLSSPSLRVGGEQLLGDALALISATFYAAYLVAVAAARERIRASALALASSVLSSLALVTFVPLGGERLLPSVAVDWIWLIGLAVILQVTPWVVSRPRRRRLDC
jgi:drug/metabolite transporter (DMT)-like permease